MDINCSVHYRPSNFGCDVRDSKFGARITSTTPLSLKPLHGSHHELPWRNAHAAIVSYFYRNSSHPPHNKLKRLKHRTPEGKRFIIFSVTLLGFKHKTRETTKAYCWRFPAQRFLFYFTLGKFNISNWLKFCLPPYATFLSHCLFKTPPQIHCAHA
jgi:hypothetical protein